MGVLSGGSGRLRLARVIRTGGKPALVSGRKAAAGALGEARRWQCEGALTTGAVPKRQADARGSVRQAGVLRRGDLRLARETMIQF
jgi:hypothetical protein